MAIDAKLLEFATERQAEAVNAYLLHGSYAAAAKAMSTLLIRLPFTLSRKIIGR